jgi:hypothetical protein
MKRKPKKKKPKKLAVAVGGRVVGYMKILEPESNEP